MVRSTKRRISDSAALGSAQPPPKDDDQSSKKPSILVQTATNNIHLLTSEPDWKTYDIGSFIKWFCRRTGKKKLCKADLEVILRSPSNSEKSIKPLPLIGGPPGQNFGLEELVVHRLWVESELEYDISAVYGITHWWFIYKISLHTTVQQWIRNLVIRNVWETSSMIEGYQTKINMNVPNWDAADVYFPKEDVYGCVPKPRASLTTYTEMIQRNLMSWNELHNFRAIETRKWSEDDKRRSKDFQSQQRDKTTYNKKGSIEKHPSETKVFHNEDGNPGYEPNHQTSSRPHKGVKASANSDVMYFFTSAQDGDPSQDDVRLCLGDDLKKAQDHSQRQAGDLL
ncbi:hypothetical protein Tco_0956916 [Tanacetum coccineum]